MNKLDINQIKSFLLEDIWRVTDDEVSKKRGMFYNAIKIVTLSIKEFTERRIVNKASALTYNTLLAIIPILAILFAIARGFGFANLLEDQFRSGLEGQAMTAETILSFNSKQDASCLLLNDKMVSAVMACPSNPLRNWSSSKLAKPNPRAIANKMARMGMIANKVL